MHNTQHQPRRLVFDCETNGFLEDLDRIHSLVLKDAASGEVTSCSNQPSGYSDIRDGVARLATADEIIGHNAIKFDVPAITKLHPDFKAPRVIDTMVLARLIWSDLKAQDGEFVKKGLPRKLYGKHTLEAWGYRLGILKGDFNESNDPDRFKVWTPEMQSYCEQDVEVTTALYQFLKPWAYSQTAIELEHAVAALLAQVERNGFPFDEPSAAKLYGELAEARERVRVQLQQLFPDWWEGEEKTVGKTQRRWIESEHGAHTRVYQKTVDGKKRKVTERGYYCLLDGGAEYTAITRIAFNPASRHHVAKKLIEKYGWKPKAYTPSGQVQVDEDILNKLPWPEAKQLARLFVIGKRLGQIAEGDQAWLKLVREGRIHGAYNPNGAVTGRAAHFFPNIAQVPKVLKSKEKGILLGLEGGWGFECRSLFHAPKGWRLVGADMSGLELRCLAHYMAHFDAGAYADIVINGDVHTVNQTAAGLASRDIAKTFIYAFLYGAGDVLLGALLQPLASEGVQRRLGRELRARFLKGLPALAKLKARVGQAVAKGFIKGLDGRHLNIRSEHAALNTLLQSAGAILCKRWIVDIDNSLRARGLRHGWDGDYAFCAWVHDEVQIAVREGKGLEDVIGETAQRCAVAAGEAFNFRCPLASEWKHGRNWAETH